MSRVIKPGTGGEVPHSATRALQLHIASRQRMGIQKYGRTVAESPDDMLRHLYEELLDAAVYVRAELERRGR